MTALLNGLLIIDTQSKNLSCLLHNDTQERTYEDPCVVEKRYEACSLFSFKERKIRRGGSEKILEES